MTSDLTGRPFGRAFLFAPPEYKIGHFDSIPVMVDIALLFLQAVAIVMGTALLVWWFQPHQAGAQSPSEKTSERSIMQQAWNASLKLPRFEANRWLGGRRRFLWLVALCLVLLALFRAMYGNP